MENLLSQHPIVKSSIEFPLFPEPPSFLLIYLSIPTVGLHPLIPNKIVTSDIKSRCTSDPSRCGGQTLEKKHSMNFMANLSLLGAWVLVCELYKCF